jgi:Na+/H+-dicarboxylate symporter
MTNVVGNALATTAVSKWEGELTTAVNTENV